MTIAIFIFRNIYGMLKQAKYDLLIIENLRRWRQWINKVSAGSSFIDIPIFEKGEKGEKKIYCFNSTYKPVFNVIDRM